MAHSVPVNYTTSNPDREFVKYSSRDALRNHYTYSPENIPFLGVPLSNFLSKDLKNNTEFCFTSNPDGEFVKYSSHDLPRNHYTYSPENIPFLGVPLSNFLSKDLNNNTEFCFYR